MAFILYFVFLLLLLVRCMRQEMWTCWYGAFKQKYSSHLYLEPNQQTNQQRRCSSGERTRKREKSEFQTHTHTPTHWNHIVYDVCTWKRRSIFTKIPMHWHWGVYNVYVHIRHIRVRHSSSSYANIYIYICISVSISKGICVCMYTYFLLLLLLLLSFSIFSSLSTSSSCVSVVKIEIRDAPKRHPHFSWHQSRKFYTPK